MNSQVQNDFPYGQLLRDAGITFHTLPMTTGLVQERDEIATVPTLFGAAYPVYDLLGPFSGGPAYGNTTVSVSRPAGRNQTDAACPDGKC